MELYEGIVLRSINYKETSKIVDVITKEGIVSMEAKGANKLSGSSHLYSNILTKIKFATSKHYLSSGEVVKKYINTYNDINRLTYATSILSLTYTLGEHISDFNVFYDFLSKILDLIEDNDNYEFYYLVFNLKILYLLGVSPMLNRCVHCNENKSLIGFDLENGGMVCKDCANKYHNFIDDNIELNNIIKMYYIKLDDLINNEFDYDFNYVNSFIERYYDKYLGYKNKTLKIMNEVRK